MCLKGSVFVIFSNIMARYLDSDATTDSGTQWRVIVDGSIGNSVSKLVVVDYNCTVGFRFWKIFGDPPFG